MKKTRVATFALVLVGLLWTVSCSKYKTYAEQLEEMEQNISGFISRHGCRVVDTIPSMVPWTDKEGVPLYYKTETGLYLHVVDTGRSSYTNFRQVVEVRYTEMDVDGDSVTYSNFGPYQPVEICKGVVSTGNGSSYFWGDCSGWHEPLDYVGDGGHVEIIVPSALGMPVYANSSTKLYAFYYELKFTYWR